MGKENGFYVLNKDHQITEAEAKELIRQLNADMTTGAPTVRWDFDPVRSNLSAFVGEYGSRVMHMESQQVPSGEKVYLDCHENGRYLYTIIDLCYEPEKSELLELYVRVSRRMRSEAWATGRLTTKRTIIIDKRTMPS